MSLITVIIIPLRPRANILEVGIVLSFVFAGA